MYKNQTYGEVKNVHVQNKLYIRFVHEIGDCASDIEKRTWYCTRNCTGRRQKGTPSNRFPDRIG